MTFSLRMLFVWTTLAAITAWASTFTFDKRFDNNQGPEIFHAQGPLASYTSCNRGGRVSIEGDYEHGWVKECKCVDGYSYMYRTPVLIRCGECGKAWRKLK